MPPVKKCPGLSHLCLECLVRNLLQVSTRPDLFRFRYELRRHLLTTYPPVVREEILSRALIRYPDTAADLMTLLLDSHIRRLSYAYRLPWECDPEDADGRKRVDETHRRHNKLSVLDWHELLTVLARSNAVGLETLVVSAWLDPLRDFSLLPRINTPYLGFVSRMKNLREIVLQGMADNKLLLVLGQCCPGLVCVDVTRSWGVDDQGVFSLCLNNGALPPPDIPPSKWPLNRCCQTLERVCIQDTCVGAKGVRVLLLSLPRLQSLGGFIYYSSVGSVVQDASTEGAGNEGGVTFELEDLWDTDIPVSKAAQLACALPKVKELYTCGEHVESASLFTKMTRLTVDLDFRDWRDPLESYLTTCGSALTHLELRDQNHPLDLRVVGSSCPSLRRLVSKLEGGWDPETDEGLLLPGLASCFVGFQSPETMVDFLSYTQGLQHADICMLETDPFRPATSQIDDTHLSLVLSREGLRNLCSFSLRSPELLSLFTLRALLHSCPNLRFVGHLQNWGLLESSEIASLEKEAASHNWDFIFWETSADLPFPKRVPISNRM